MEKQANRYEVQVLTTFEKFEAVDWYDDESAALARGMQLSHEAMTRVKDLQTNIILCHFADGYLVRWWDMVREVLTGWLRRTG